MELMELVCPSLHSVESPPFKIVKVVHLLDHRREHRDRAHKDDRGEGNMVDSREDIHLRLGFGVEFRVRVKVKVGVKVGIKVR